jgi:hypothetical protein
VVLTSSTPALSLLDQPSGGVAGAFAFDIHAAPDDAKCGHDCFIKRAVTHAHVTTHSLLPHLRLPPVALEVLDTRSCFVRTSDLPRCNQRLVHNTLTFSKTTAGPAPCLL